MVLKIQDEVKFPTALGSLIAHKSSDNKYTF